MQKKMFLGSAILAAASAFVAGCDKPEAEATEQQANVALEQPAVPTGVESDIVALPPPPKDADVIVSVGSAQMTWAELNKQVDQMVALAAEQYGQPVPSEELPKVKQNFRRMAVQTFVVENIICQAAANAGIVIDDAYRATEIAAIEKEAGKAIDELFAAHPAGVERAKDMFEKGLLEKRLLEEKVFASIAVSEEEVKAALEKNVAELALMNEKLAECEQKCAEDPAAFEAFVVADSLFKEPLTRPDNEFQRVFGVAWEKVAQLQKGQISPVLDLDGLKMMVKCVEQTPAGDEAGVKTKIDELRNRILAGEDFATLAREFSACPSGQRGGDLNTFTKGQMVPEFEAAAFTQEIGKVGEPVKTPFGYHLILVTERDEAAGTARASHILLTTPSATRTLAILALSAPQVKTEAMLREEMVEQRKRQAAMDFFETQRQSLGVTSTLFPELSVAPKK